MKKGVSLLIVSAMESLSGCMTYTAAKGKWISYKKATEQNLIVPENFYSRKYALAGVSHIIRSLNIRKLNRKTLLTDDVVSYFRKTKMLEIRKCYKAYLLFFMFVQLISAQL